MDTRTMWVDSDRCTGCGDCVEVCPAEAIALVEGKARVDEESCIGCGDCADECPQNAIQPVVQGELVPAPQRPAPTVYRPSPLAQTAGTAVVVAGTGLLMKAAGALARSVSRWLTRRPAPTRPPASGAARADGEADRGRRARHRRRGQ
jgi:Fe-S-cluster-containing hydrogenase component 2